MMWIPLATGAIFMATPASVTRGIAMPPTTDTPMTSAQVNIGLIFKKILNYTCTIIIQFCPFSGGKQGKIHLEYELSTKSMCPSHFATCSRMKITSQLFRDQVMTNHGSVCERYMSKQRKTVIGRYLSVEESRLNSESFLND